MANVALTTVDNPYSPFSEFDSWYNYDLEKGYDCCGYIDRMSFGKLDSNLINEEQEDELIEQVINDIVNTDPTGIYIKVEKVNETNENKDNKKDFKLSNPFDK